MTDCWKIKFPGLAVVLIFLLVISIFFAGCSKEEPPKPKDLPTAVEEDKEFEEPAVPDYYVQAPLTGLLVDPRYIERRPVAVMVENAPAARPQTGLNEADVVYEVLAEGGITRFLAVYLSQDAPSVGPVRSARPYYIERALEYNALYVHCGGSEEAKKFIKATRIADMDEFGIGRQGKAFWREKFRKAPHNLYGNTARIRTLAVNKGYKEKVGVPQFSFLGEEEPFPEGIRAEKIVINYPRSYSKVSYTFDSDKKEYLRSNGGIAHKDLVTGKQLRASNILVQFTDTKILDKEGRLKVQMTGKGRALLFTGGRIYRGFWKKESSYAWTFFTDETGETFKLKPGQTWIQVVTTKTVVDYE